MARSQVLTTPMRVIETAAEMSQACRDSDRPVALVPTMGSLHADHLSLVNRARLENDTVAESIFVNPRQFGPGEDLDQYPRDLERDLDLLRQHRVDLVYAPQVDLLYPDRFSTRVDVGPIANKLEGAAHPGHFRGVATVASKLFNTMRPERAYFGQKDGQQTVAVEKLVRDLDLGVEIIVLPTVREDDGLEMSSRNVRLSPEQHHAAPVLCRALDQAKNLWDSGETDVNRLRDAVAKTLGEEPLLESIDYVSVADAVTLEESESVSARTMVSAAVTMGPVRLIDNVFLG